MIKRKKFLYIFLFIFLFGLGIFFLYERKTEKFKQIENQENIELAIYINEEETNSIPSKDSGYYYDREKSSCTNGAYINWDSISWSPVVNNMNEYKTRCELHFTTRYTEGILNGTDPVLEDELVPVTIEDNGTVKKADLESEWYSYANKEWANAVILEDQYDSLNTQGKVYGATKEDGYVSFDGVDDYIDLGLENYEFTNGITLMATVKIAKPFPENNTWYEFLSNAEGAGAILGFIYEQSGIMFRMQAHINDQYYYTSVTYEEEIKNSWHTVVGTYDGTKLKLYVDGSFASEIEMTGTITPSIMPFFMGANPEISINASCYSNIDVKTVAIYNRAISDEEISLISEGKVANNEGLLQYVDFTNKNYEDNEIIPEEKIESYFVWIPKYRYQLWDLGQYDSLTAIDESKVHEIPIIFGDYNTNDEREGECTTPMESGATGICNIGDYMTHPAFISIPSTGFWVGKFETGYNGATSTAEAEQNVNDSSKIIVKPNTYSWRGIQVANAFYSSYNYQRELDSHMMKNTEWGAVAYLQHSACGSAMSVRNNNNSDYITGYAANEEPTCGWTGTNEECNRHCNDGTCNTAYPNSLLASTTGNISGIYDMSGGAWEYVMGVMEDEVGNLMSGNSESLNSGFNGKNSDDTTTIGHKWLEKKYYDIYLNNNNNKNYKLRILGDITGETGPFQNIKYLEQIRNSNSWYRNYALFLICDNPFFIRGGNMTRGVHAGVFSFGYTHGDSNNASGFRIILTPTNGGA